MIMRKKPKLWPNKSKWWNISQYFCHHDKSWNHDKSHNYDVIIEIKNWNDDKLLKWLDKVEVLSLPPSVKQIAPPPARRHWSRRLWSGSQWKQWRTSAVMKWSHPEPMNTWKSDESLLILCSLFNRPLLSTEHRIIDLIALISTITRFVAPIHAAWWNINFSSLRAALKQTAAL